MKLIIQNTRIAATATDDYTGPDEYITAPEDFDPARMGEYRVMDGVAVLPDVVPTSCTPAQGLVALYALKGITEDSILTAIAQILDPVQRYTAQIGYSRAITWERESQTMQAMAALLSLSEQDLDDLFIYAAEVEI